MDNQNKPRIVIMYILVVVFILAIISCIVYIASSDLTENEAGLLSIILTILSITATWVVANIFARISHKKAIDDVKEQHLNNLKTYALNAAEKVDNLSNELSRLSVYLQEEIEKDEEEESEHSKTERLESAIHIINTLKSVNDTSLSDWKGVIGDELDERREEKMEREIELRDLVDRVEELINYQDHHFKNIRHIQSNEQIRNIQELRKELTLALNSVSGSVIKPKRIKIRREQVGNACPHCGHQLKYKQRPMVSSYKQVKCTKCNNKSLAKWYVVKGFVLEQEEIKDERVNCPVCQEQVTISLSNIPGIKSIELCPKCNEQFKLSRRLDGITISKYKPPPTPELNLDDMEEDELIERVKQKLPQQPWPTGIHKQIAQELGVTNHQVSYIINRLIRNGVFVPQIDGILYYKREVVDKANTENAESES